MKWYTFLTKLKPHLRKTTGYIEVRPRSARLNSLTSIVPSSKEEDSSRAEVSWGQPQLLSDPLTWGTITWSCTSAPGRPSQPGHEVRVPGLVHHHQADHLNLDIISKAETDCLLCKTGKGKWNCSKRNLVYEWARKIEKWWLWQQAGVIPYGEALHQQPGQERPQFGMRVVRYRDRVVRTMPAVPWTPTFLLTTL